MLALKITDIRDFTNKLFIGEVFDKFCLSEATVTTFNGSLTVRYRKKYSQIA